MGFLKERKLCGQRRVNNPVARENSKVLIIEFLRKDSLY